MRSNLKHVIKFEIVRNIKRPTFWIGALILPILLVGYVAIAGLSGYNAEQTAMSASDTSNMRLGLYDASNFITTDTVTYPDETTQKLTLVSSEEQGIADVKNDKLDVFYYVPADFDQTFAAKVYAKTDSTSIFSNYETPLRTLLSTSAAEHIDPADFAVASGAVQISTTNFTVENTEFDVGAQIAKMIIPGVGLILFYVLICMFGNRLTTAMVEEKENRISEMILTSLRPRDLITGKVISLIVIGFIQLLVLIIPTIIIAIFGFANNIIPADLQIDFNFWTIASTVILLLSSYFLFASLCVAVGTLVPTAKDASQFAGVLMIMVILPLFFLNSFMSAGATDSMTYFLSFFPPSAPIALMFRNTFGTLPILEFVIGVAIILIASFLVIKFAVFVYTRTAIEFTSRVNLRKLFSKPRKDWGKSE